MNVYVPILLGGRFVVKTLRFKEFCYVFDHSSWMWLCLNLLFHDVDQERTAAHAFYFCNISTLRHLHSRANSEVSIFIEIKENFTALKTLSTELTAICLLRLKELILLIILLSLRPICNLREFVNTKS